MAAPPSGGCMTTELASIDAAELRRGEASTSGRDAVLPAIARAAAILAAGDVVAIPTETVYGLAANALSASAVGKIYAAKNRPADNPLIVHVSSLGMLASLYPDGWSLPPIYEAIVRDLWPGPLTILVPRSPLVPDAVTCGLPTMAVRMPAHPIALRLIATCGFPLAAPSANSSGRPSPTLARHVMSDLAGRIPLVLDGGPCTCGVESTVLDGLRSPPAILRPGGVTREQLAAYPGLEGLQVYRRDFVDAQLEAAPTTPGMKYRHYSPTAPVLLLDPGEARRGVGAAEGPSGRLAEGQAGNEGGSGRGGEGGGGGVLSDEELAAKLRAGVAALLAELAAARAVGTAAAAADGNGAAERRGPDGGAQGDAARAAEAPQQPALSSAAPAAAGAGSAVGGAAGLVVGVLRTSVADVPAGPLRLPFASDAGIRSPHPGPHPQPSGCTDGNPHPHLADAWTAEAGRSPGDSAATITGAPADPDSATTAAAAPGTASPSLAVVEYALGHLSRPESVAAELFAALRRMDELHVGVIVVEGVRDEGAGVAVMNRLRKAASRVVRL